MSATRGRRTVLFCGGGTGGHLYPGIAVADELRRRAPGLVPVFVGTPRGVEAEVLPRLGYPLETLDVSFVRGTGVRGWLRGGGRLPRAGLDALRILERHRPAVVVSLGGYAAGPVTATAAVLGIPTALLEQNVVPGLTTRLLSRLVDRCFLGFDDAARYFRAGAWVVVGNPIRRELSHGAERPVGDPREPLRILVTGGARGSRPINAHLPAILHRAARSGRAFQVRHQAGRDRAAEVSASYAGLGLDAEVHEYIGDMPASYRWADLVIARAGGSTLAELLAMGLPSVLVPFAGAADAHQLRNAEVVARDGAAVVVREDMLATGEADAAIGRLLGDPGRLSAMSLRARALARPDAAADVADALVAMALPARRQGRGFDVLAASAGIVATLPLLGASAALIVLDDGRPVLFVQPRIGRDRVAFDVIKLRTMRDGRVTAIGRVLRAMGLDELPQLLNVMRGDMSLVGPRPITASDVRRLGWEAPTYDLRFTVRPGITGMVQVVGTAGASRSFELERSYIEGRSLGLDLELLAASGLMVVFGRARVRAWLPIVARHRVLVEALASAAAR